MKKVFITLLFAFSLFAVTSQAQVSPGHLAKDFNLTPLNSGGVPVHLYEWLDAGKTVILDVSATWCNPCWKLHKSGLLEELNTKYGVGSTTNDLRVVYVEGDASTTDADMRGETEASQGNWLEGTDFPMCNPDSLTTLALTDAYEVGYFPTLFIICPNRSAMELTQANYMKVVNNVATYKTAEEVYAYIKSITCPELIQHEAKLNYALSTLPITFTNTFGFKFQTKNTGAMDLDSFTVTLKGDGKVYQKVDWKTKLSPFQYSGVLDIESTEIPDKTSYITLDITPHTNVDTVSESFRFKVAAYSDATKYKLPFTEDFESKEDWPALFGMTPILANSIFSLANSIQLQDGPVSVIGADGNQTRAILIPFYMLNTQNQKWIGTVSIGNFDALTAVDTIKFDFDYSYAVYPGQSDKLEIVYSTNQGTSWSSAWSKSGTSLATTDTTSSFYIPSEASQWKHGTTLIKVAGKENVLVGIRATSAYGNNCYVDNLKLYGVTMNGVEDNTPITIGVFPNPASNYFSVRGYNGAAKMFDVTGREVWNGNVTDGLNTSIETLVPGVYYIDLGGKMYKIVKQ